MGYFVEITCSSPPIGLNTNHDADVVSYAVGDTYKYQCDDTYSFYYEDWFATEITCEKSGEWSAGAISCTRMYIHDSTKIIFLLT